MIDKTLLEQFRLINDQYYYVIEYYHFQNIKQLMPAELSLRDSYTLFVIHNQEKLQQNTSTNIANLTGLSPSSFSNHLRVLERVGVVKRHRDTVNRKLMVVELTKQGRDIYKSLMNHFKELFLFIHSKLGIGGDVSLLQTVLLISNEISPEPPLTAKLYQPKKFIEQLAKALTRIYFFISIEEASMLDQLEIKLTIRESRFLQSLYEFSLIDQASPSIVANYLGHPMSTVTSLINSLEDKGLIKRLENKIDRRRYDLKLTLSSFEYIERYMRFRVDMSKRLFKVTTKKMQDVVNVFFAGVKEFSIDRMNEYESTK